MNWDAVINHFTRDTGTMIIDLVLAATGVVSVLYVVYRLVWGPSIFRIHPKVARRALAEAVAAGVLEIVPTPATRADYRTRLEEAESLAADHG